MSEKSKNLWKIAALTVFEMLILITICNVNANSFSLGAGGERVAALQRMLRESGAYGGKINGIFDLETRNALIRRFPECRGEANSEILKSLGLDCNACGFSSLSEITARYISLRLDGEPFCEMKRKLEKEKISAVMRRDRDFLSKLIKLEPSSDACDCAYKFEAGLIAAWQ